MASSRVKPEVLGPWICHDLPKSTASVLIAGDGLGVPAMGVVDRISNQTGAERVEVDVSRHEPKGAPRLDEDGFKAALVEGSDAVVGSVVPLSEALFYVLHELG